MEVVKLLHELERLGVVLSLEDGLLVFLHTEAVPAELMFKAAVEYRQEICDLLRLRQPGGSAAIRDISADKGED